MTKVHENAPVLNDALDYSDENKTGKPVGGDLQERKITLPLSHLIEKANDSDRRRLDQILTNQEIEKTIDEIVSKIDYHCNNKINYDEFLVISLDTKTHFSTSGPPVGTISGLISIFPQSFWQSAAFICTG